MEKGSERRKHYRARKNHPNSIRIAFDKMAGLPKVEMVATVLDISDEGCRIRIQGPLGVGSMVYVDKGALSRSGKSETWMARVAWCSFDQDGSYSAGLNLEVPAKNASVPPDQAEPGAPKPVPDHYEVLQLNAKADPDTIHRVYRLLAQRFHPDNKDSGDDELFRRLNDAYKVLSDPEQRAAYDIKLNEHNKHRWRIFDQSSATDGLGAEKAKRTGMLLVMYTRKRNEPAQAAMSVHEMEDLLGCPKEHLEFGLWFLREKGFIVRNDNGKYAITATGVEAAEESELPWAPKSRMLDSGPEPGIHHA